MKKLVVLFFSLSILMTVATTATAQSQKVRQEDKPAAQSIPQPKKTHVEYAPGKAPTLKEQIQTDEKKLKQLKAIPANKRSTFTKKRIATLEKGLVEKRKKAKSTTTKQ